MKLVLVIAVLFFHPFVPDRTANDGGQTQSREQKILTATDFKEGGAFERGSGREEVTFWLQVSQQLPPYKFRLIPDLNVGADSGPSDAPRRVGRIEISARNPLAVVQTIEVRTRASGSTFTKFF